MTKHHQKNNLKKYLELIDLLSDEYKLLLEESKEIKDSAIKQEAVQNGFNEEELSKLTKHFLKWKNDSLKALEDPLKVQKIQEYFKRFKK